MQEMSPTPSPLLGCFGICYVTRSKTNTNVTQRHRLAEQPPGSEQTWFPISGLTVLPLTEIF